MPRPPELDLQNMTPDQRQVYDQIASGPRGVVQGPLQVWLTSPALAERAQELGAFCRYHTCLTPRLSELAILITGAYWKAEFEWHIHAPIAESAGLSAETIEAIRRGEAPKLKKIDEAAVYTVSHELLHDKAISDKSYEQAENVLGERGLVELIGILGYYALISMTIKAFEVPIPDDSKKAFG